MLQTGSGFSGIISGETSLKSGAGNTKWGKLRTTKCGQPLLQRRATLSKSEAGITTWGSYYKEKQYINQGYIRESSNSIALSNFPQFLTYHRVN